MRRSQSVVLARPHCWHQRERSIGENARAVTVYMRQFLRTCAGTVADRVARGSREGGCQGTAVPLCCQITPLCRRRPQPVLQVGDLICNNDPTQLVRRFLDLVSSLRNPPILLANSKVPKNVCVPHAAL